MRREARCFGRGALADGVGVGVGEDGTVAGSCRRDASVADSGAKVEAFRRVEGTSARREILEVDGLEMCRRGGSGSVEEDEESVSGETTTPEEVMLIIDVETNSGGVRRAGVTAEGSTIAAEAVKLGMECLRNGRTAHTTEMRRSRPTAAVHMSLCSRGRLHQEILARGVVIAVAGLFRAKG
jgi:hypothetical protein